MRKIIFGLILLTLFSGCALNRQSKNNINGSQNVKFAVYLLDTNQMIFSEDDVASYNSSSNTFTFTEQGAKKMKLYQTSLYIYDGLYQKCFVAKLGDEEIYRGKFWTGLSSLSEPGIVMSDVVIVGPDYNTLTVANSYPWDGLSPNNEEKINDARIIEHFREINKIVTNNKASLIQDIYQFAAINFHNITFDIVKIEPKNLNLITFYYKDKNNQKFGTIASLSSWLEIQGKKLIFATNGGIFSKNYTPMGLYIENGKKISDLNTNDGEGNFYLKPNGVLLIKQGGAEIIETSKYQNFFDILFALQSGPMLVSNKVVNPLFEENSQSKYIRSGVGITLNGNVVFAISNEPVTLYEFALFFKDNLGCNNALYLDGAISEMYVPKLRENTKEEFSVIIGVTGK